MFVQKKSIVLLVYCVLGLTSVLFAQGERIIVSKQDSIYFKRIKDSFNYYLNRSFYKAEELALQEIEFSEQKQVEQWKGYAYSDYAIILLSKGGNKNFEKSKKYIQKSKDIFVKIPDSTIVMGFNNYLFIADYKGNMPLDELLPLAYKYVDEIRSHLRNDRDTNNLAIAYGNIAIVYNDIKLIDSTIVYYNKSYQLFKAVNSDHQYTVAANLGVAYKEIEEYEKAITQYKIAENGFKQNKVKRYLSSTYAELAECYEGLRLYKKSMKNAKKSVMIAKKNNFDTISPFYQLSNAYFRSNQLDSADYYLNKVLASDILDLDLELKANQLKAKLEEKFDRVDDVLDTYKKIKELKDSLDKINQPSKIMGVLLEEESKKQENLETNHTIALLQRNRTLVGLVAGLLLLVVLFYVFFLKNTSRYNVLKKKEKVLTKELKEVIGQKDYINRKMLTNSINLAVKNDLLTNVNYALGEIKSANLSKRAKQDIQVTKEFIEDNMELNKVWENFFTHFDEVNPSFIHTLSSKYDLSQGDLRICAFMKMNLSNKEISQILNIKLNSVHIAIHRIKKKLNLPEEQSVFNFLHSEKEIKT